MTRSDYNLLLGVLENLLFFRLVVWIWGHQPVATKKFHRSHHTETINKNDFSEESDSEENNQLPWNEIPYECISAKGSVLGKATIVNTALNKLIHGRSLQKKKRKVLVKVVYEDHAKDAEEEEFIEGAFFWADKIMLKKLLLKKEKRQGTKTWKIT